MKTDVALALTIAPLSAFPAAAQVNFKATPFLQSDITVTGARVAYPVTDSAEVTALLLEIGPGGETGRHMHPHL